ncbi:MAG: hypothetical protein R2733_19885 [Acidimicrobiales bacterium]
MIRPVATLPPKERERLRPPGDAPLPATTPPRRSGHPWWFVVLEVMLLLSVPLLGYFGGRALLSTKAGTFTSQPEPGEPGWHALVDPSPVVAIAEVLDDRVTGLVVVAEPGQGTAGGALIMVPGALQLADGRRLSELSPSDALAGLSVELRLGFTETYVVSPTDWAAVIGDKAYEIDNPDPIAGADGELVFPVGRVTVDATTAAVFLGASEVGTNPLSLLYRRELFWQALLADPPTTIDPVAVLIEQVTAGTERIDDLPTEQLDNERVIDPEGAEALINTVVPLPSGSQPGDRVAIRVVDRSGQHDTQAIALALGALGLEVTEIANAAIFDDGPTQLVVPSSVDIEAMRELAADLGADTVSPDPVDETELSTVVLLVGNDIDLGG